VLPTAATSKLSHLTRSRTIAPLTALQALTKPARSLIPSRTLSNSLRQSNHGRGDWLDLPHGELSPPILCQLSWRTPSRADFVAKVILKRSRIVIHGGDAGILRDRTMMGGGSIGTKGSCSIASTSRRRFRRIIRVRRIAEVLDLSWVHAELASHYSPEAPSRKRSPRPCRARASGCSPCRRSGRSTP
jgi:hypothetical protein